MPHFAVRLLQGIVPALAVLVTDAFTDQCSYVPATPQSYLDGGVLIRDIPSSECFFTSTTRESTTTSQSTGTVTITSTATTKTETTTAKRFDCRADLHDWERAWSVHKSTWCCQNEQLGCPPTTTTTATMSSSATSTKSTSTATASTLTSSTSTSTTSSSSTTASSTSTSSSTTSSSTRSSSTSRTSATSTSSTATTYSTTSSSTSSTSISSTSATSTMTTSTMTTNTRSTTTSRYFECNADEDNWVTGWSDEKKAWCCQRQQLGCPATTTSTITETTSTDTTQTTSSATSSSTSSTRTTRTETTTTSMYFNCGAAYSNWEAAWSEVKKQWCCAKEQLGCPPTTTSSATSSSITTTSSTNTRSTSTSSTITSSTTTSSSTTSSSTSSASTSSTSATSTMTTSTSSTSTSLTNTSLTRTSSTTASSSTTSSSTSSTSTSSTSTTSTTTTSTSSTSLTKTSVTTTSSSTTSSSTSSTSTTSTTTTSTSSTSTSLTSTSSSTTSSSTSSTSTSSTSAISTSTTSMTTTNTRSTTTTRYFNCSADANWEASWSEEKKAWCCQQEQVGCPTTSTITETTSTATTQTTSITTSSSTTSKSSTRTRSTTTSYSTTSSFTSSTSTSSTSATSTMTTSTSLTRTSSTTTSSSTTSSSTSSASSSSTSATNTMTTSSSLTSTSSSTTSCSKSSTSTSSTSATSTSVTTTSSSTTSSSTSSTFTSSTSATSTATTSTSLTSTSSSTTSSSTRSSSTSSTSTTSSSTGSTSGTGTTTTSTTTTGTITTSTMTTNTRSTTTSRYFECNADEDNWVTGWSDEKKAWCCQRQQLGCPATTTSTITETTSTDTTQTTSSATSSSTSSTRTTWTETTTTSMYFNCGAAYSNWEAAWSEVKKQWCCAKEQLGCPPTTTSSATSSSTTTSTGTTSTSTTTSFTTWTETATTSSTASSSTTTSTGTTSTSTTTSFTTWTATATTSSTASSSTTSSTTTTSTVTRTTTDAFDCIADVANWETGWSVQKQAWCCTWARVACPPTTSSTSTQSTSTRSTSTGTSSSQSVTLTTSRTSTSSRTSTTSRTSTSSRSTFTTTEPPTTCHSFFAMPESEDGEVCQAAGPGDRCLAQVARLDSLPLCDNSSPARLLCPASTTSTSSMFYKTCTVCATLKVQDWGVSGYQLSGDIRWAPTATLQNMSLITAYSVWLVDQCGAKLSPVGTVAVKQQEWLPDMECCHPSWEFLEFGVLHTSAASVGLLIIPSQDGVALDGITLPIFQSTVRRSSIEIGGCIGLSMADTASFTDPGNSEIVEQVLRETIAASLGKKILPQYVEVVSMADGVTCPASATRRLAAQISLTYAIAIPPNVPVLEDPIAEPAVQTVEEIISEKMRQHPALAHIAVTVTSFSAVEQSTTTTWRSTTTSSSSQTLTVLLPTSPASDPQMAQNVTVVAFTGATCVMLVLFGFGYVYYRKRAGSGTNQETKIVQELAPSGHTDTAQQDSGHVDHFRVGRCTTRSEEQAAELSAVVVEGPRNSRGEMALKPMSSEEAPDKKPRAQVTKCRRGKGRRSTKLNAAPATAEAGNASDAPDLLFSSSDEEAAKNADISTEEGEDEEEDLIQEVEVGPEVANIGLSFCGLPPEPVVVNKVAAGTWAKAVGFLGGEEILALNDEDVAAMTSERFESLLKSRPLLIRLQTCEFEEVIAGEEVTEVGLSFLALPPERVVVHKVAPGTWAASVGFRGGEEVAAVNGVAVSDMSSEDFKSLLKKRPLALRIVSSTVTADEPETQPVAQETADLSAVVVEGPRNSRGEVAVKPTSSEEAPDKKPRAQVTKCRRGKARRSTKLNAAPTTAEAGNASDAPDLLFSSSDEEAAKNANISTEDSAFDKGQAQGTEPEMSNVESRLSRVPQATPTTAEAGNASDAPDLLFPSSDEEAAKNANISTEDSAFDKGKAQGTEPEMSNVKSRLSRVPKAMSQRTSRAQVRRERLQMRKAESSKNVGATQEF